MKVYQDYDYLDYDTKTIISNVTRVLVFVRDIDKNLNLKITPLFKIYFTCLHHSVLEKIKRNQKKYL